MSVQYHTRYRCKGHTPWTGPQPQAVLCDTETSKKLEPRSGPAQALLRVFRLPSPSLFFFFFFAVWKKEQNVTAHMCHTRMTK